MFFTLIKFDFLRSQIFHVWLHAVRRFSLSDKNNQVFRPVQISMRGYLNIILHCSVPVCLGLFQNCSQIDFQTLYLLFDSSDKYVSCSKTNWLFKILIHNKHKLLKSETADIRNISDIIFCVWSLCRDILCIKTTSETVFVFSFQCLLVFISVCGSSSTLVIKSCMFSP